MAQPPPSLYALDPALPVLLRPDAEKALVPVGTKAFGGSDSLIDMVAKLREFRAPHG
jgi:hypothetical protein